MGKKMLILVLMIVFLFSTMSCANNLHKNNSPEKSTDIEAVTLNKKSIPKVNIYNYLPEGAKSVFIKSVDLDNDGIEEKIITFNQGSESMGFILAYDSKNWKKYNLINIDPDTSDGPNDPVLGNEYRQIPFFIDDINRDGKKEIYMNLLGGTHGDATHVFSFEGSKVMTLISVSSHYRPETIPLFKDAARGLKEILTFNVDSEPVSDPIKGTVKEYTWSKKENRYIVDKQYPYEYKNDNE